MIRHFRRIQYIVVRNAVGQGWTESPVKKSVSDDETHIHIYSYIFIYIHIYSYIYTHIHI